MPCLAPPESGDSCVIRRRADGGLESEVDGKRGKDIYFMGIIDILQVPYKPCLGGKKKCGKMDSRLKTSLYSPVLVLDRRLR